MASDRADALRQGTNRSAGDRFRVTVTPAKPLEGSFASIRTLEAVTTIPARRRSRPSPSPLREPSVFGLLSTRGTRLPTSLKSFGYFSVTYAGAVRTNNRNHAVRRLTCQFIRRWLHNLSRSRSVISDISIWGASRLAKPVTILKRLGDAHTSLGGVAIAEHGKGLGRTPHAGE